VRESFELWGYQICWRGDWISDLWSRIWFRWYCPYPVIEDHKANACIAAGKCGCSNGADVRESEISSGDTTFPNGDR
jgi:hypothetical protein